MKKQLLLFILALLPMLAMADNSGKCGDNVTYHYSDFTQTLTIQGTGEMYDYPDSRPWAAYKTYIEKIVIKNGVTCIGEKAFYNCTGLTSIEIPNSVTSIKRNALGATALISVTIPNSVTSIGEKAFYNCTSLTSIAIPNSVTSIGEDAFSGCSGLTSVTLHCNDVGAWFKGLTSIKEVVIGSEVTSIGERAFYNCSGLTSITIPNSVTSIGEDAFQGCSGLTSVTIPNSVTSIGDYAFYNCSALKKVIAPDIAAWCGIEFGDSYANPLFYAHHLYSDDNTEITELVIPDGVTRIGSYAFNNCSDLTSVTIPNSVTSIGNYAFSGTAWYGNQPDGLIYAGKVAYKYKGTMPTSTSITIKDGTCGIAGGAFQNCSGLASIDIPNSVTSIGTRAFDGCSKLTSVTIPNSVTSIGEWAFDYCLALKKVIAPDIAAWCGINFGDEAANPLYYVHHLYSDDNTEITELVIPDGVTSIGNHAFERCSGLTSVTIPNSVTSIGEYAFNGCSGLTSVTIGSGVTSIGWGAFEGCSGLTSVTIPNSVTSIGWGAFEGCSGLTSVTIGSGVTSMRGNAFSGCSGLTSVTINSDGILSYTFSSSFNFSTIFGGQVKQYIIGNSVKSIGNYAFYNCSGLASIDIPNSVTSIGSYAFSGCSGLTSVTIPNSVTSIGGYAFSGCSKLTCVYSKIGNVFGIADNTFSSETYNNAELRVPPSFSYNYKQASGWKKFNSITEEGGQICGDNLTYTYSEASGKLTIQGTGAMYDYSSSSPAPWNSYKGDIITIVIEDGATSVGSYAFYGCSNLYSVTFGKDVKTVGSSAFSGCSIKKVIALDNVTSIGSSAFYGCSGLASVTIGSGVTSIGSSAFYGCSGLQKVIAPDIAAWCGIKFGNETANPLYYVHHLYSDDNTEITELVIPDGVTSIGSYAFFGWSVLPSVTIPNSVTSIGSAAFSGCSGLTSVTIPNSVTSIGGSAFSGCSGLTSVTINSDAILSKTYTSSSNLSNIFGSQVKQYIIGNSVTSIGDYAFRGCSSLTSIEIPNSVTSIGEYAFSGCSGLTSVTIGSGVTSMRGNAFSGCSGLTSVTINSDGILSYTFSSSFNFSTIFGGQVKQYIIGNSVTSIGNYAFYNCSGLTSITIPNSVTSIGGDAFNKCSGLQKVIAPDIAAWCGISFSGSAANPLYYAHHLYSDDNTEITELVIPDGVTSIGQLAFSDCSSLTSVTIPNSVTSIGSYAFSGCSGLKKVIVPDIAAWCGISFSGSAANPLYYVHHLYSDDNTEITELVIPDGVTSIRDYAFSGCSGLTSVTIGTGVTSIGSYAFNGCSALKKVIVPDIAAWCGIEFGDNPLNYAHHLYSDDNTEITELVIPNGVTSIGQLAFSGWSVLNSVTIPNSVTSIGSTAFNGCSKLASVTFHCNNVGTWFSGKISIKEVWIEKEVTSIAQQSFAGCSGLQSVYNNAEDVFTIAKNTFDDATYSSATLYVPTGMKATYEETPWWLNFNKKEEYDFPTGITIPQQSKDVKVVDAYQINGLKTGSMQKGLNILKMSDGTTRKVVK